MKKNKTKGRFKGKYLYFYCKHCHKYRPQMGTGCKCTECGHIAATRTYIGWWSVPQSQR